MAQIFNDLLLQGIRAGQMPAREQTAREWYRNKAKSLGRVNETKLMKDSTNVFHDQFRIGNLYHFYYDPKHKATLPYYDRFPLVFPINKAKGGFLGINMHYLPLKMRAQLMDALYETANNTRYDDTTKLKINYKILNSAAKFRFFAPTIKHYLHNHINSRLMYIHPAEWDISLFLSSQKWMSQTQSGVTSDLVYSDSKKIIRGF